MNFSSLVLTKVTKPLISVLFFVLPLFQALSDSGRVANEETPQPRCNELVGQVDPQDKDRSDGDPLGASLKVSNGGSTDGIVKSYSYHRPGKDDV